MAGSKNRNLRIRGINGKNRETSLKKQKEEEGDFIGGLQTKRGVQCAGRAGYFWEERHDHAALSMS